MPHIDDGILHASLDGALNALAAEGALPAGVVPADIEAHLRACADCRARLEAERAVREQAGAVLRDAGATVPASELPPFEHLTRLRADRRRRSGGWMPLAWAASLVLAIGAGWSASMLWRGGAAEFSVASPESASPAGPAADEAADPAVADGRKPAVTQESAVARESAEGTVDVAQARPAPAEEPSAAAPSPPQGRRALAPEEAPVRAEPSLSEVAAAAAPVRAPMAAPPAPAPPPAAAPAAAPRTASFDALAVGGGRSGLNAALMLADAERLEWLPLPAHDEEPVHRQVIVLDGGGPAAVEMAIVPSAGGTLVRIRQRAEDGGVVELYTWRVQEPALEELAVTAAPVERRREAAQQSRLAEPRAPSPSPPAEARAGSALKADAAPARLLVLPLADSMLRNGVRQLTVRVPASGVYAVLRADLPASDLAALAERLVPAH